MYIKVIIKTIFIYFFIISMYKVMGKKEIGQLSIIDLIVSILIAGLSVTSIENPDKSIFISVVPIIIIVSMQYVIGYISMKNHKFRKLIEGTPSVIIKRGKLQFKEMVKLRYTLDDLILQLREHGIKSIEDVNYAVLENNGKLSIFKKENEYPFPIILDGKIDELVLEEIGKDTVWLYNILKNRNIDLNEVFYAFYKKDKTFIITKEETIN